MHCTYWNLPITIHTIHNYKFINIIKSNTKFCCGANINNVILIYTFKLQNKNATLLWIWGEECMFMKEKKIFGIMTTKIRYVKICEIWSWAQPTRNVKKNSNNNILSLLILPRMKTETPPVMTNQPTGVKNLLNSTRDEFC